MRQISGDDLKVVDQHRRRNPPIKRVFTARNLLPTPDMGALLIKREDRHGWREQRLPRDSHPGSAVDYMAPTTFMNTPCCRKLRSVKFSEKFVKL